MPDLKFSVDLPKQFILDQLARQIDAHLKSADEYKFELKIELLGCFITKVEFDAASNPVELDLSIDLVKTKIEGESYLYSPKGSALE